MTQLSDQLGKETITVSEYIVRYLEALGVRNAYMLSGTGSIYLDDAFLTANRIRCVNARHEAAAALMSMADAKLNNRPSVVVATTGPGGLNALSGIAEAWVDSTPVIVISGQVASSSIDTRLRSFGVQGFNIVESVSEITKHAVLIREPEDIKPALDTAVEKLTSGRPGPIWIDVPLNVQSAKICPDTLGIPDFATLTTNSELTGPSESLINNCQSLMELLKGSQRPVIIVGQGVRQAKAKRELENLVNRFQIPVLQSRMGQDLLAVDYEVVFGLVGIRGKLHSLDILSRADLVLSLGSSLPHSIIGEEECYISSDANIVMVDHDESEMAKPGLKVNLSIVEDVKLFMSEMMEQSGDIDPNQYLSWLNECRQIAQNSPLVSQAETSDPINTYHLVSRIEHYSKDDAVFICDAGGSYYAVGQALRFLRGQRELTSSAFASMGACLPMAVGAASSAKNRQVIAIVGDGSIETNIQELITISEYSLPVKIFVINNGGYASIRDSQDELCDGRYTDGDRVLNFEKVADTFSLAYSIVESCSDIESVVPKVLDDDNPTLIEVVCDMEQVMKKPKVTA